MQKCNIKSSTSVKEAHYSAATQVLRVEFQSGVVYEYSKVPNDLIAAWESVTKTKSGSVGNFFHHFIKLGTYPFKKV